VTLDASNLELMSGSSVSVALPKDQANLSIMVPRDALILREQETFVVTIDEKELAHKIEVTVGRGIKEWISVQGKISAGERVVTRGGERLQSGDKVRLDNTEMLADRSIAAK